MPVAVVSDNESAVNDSNADDAKPTASDSAAAVVQAQNTVLVVAGGEGYVDFRAGRRTLCT
jgi:hypothetical protein